MRQRGQRGLNYAMMKYPAIASQATEAKQKKAIRPMTGAPRQREEMLAFTSIELRRSRCCE
jgi:hypothetical protein